jgi:hypothetical protein
MPLNRRIVLEDSEIIPIQPKEDTQVRHLRAFILDDVMEDDSIDGPALAQVIKRNPELQSESYKEFLNLYRIGARDEDILCKNCGKANDLVADFENRIFMCKSCGAIITFEQFQTEHP